jgi:signal transduction histidine kinase
MDVLYITAIAILLLMVIFLMFRQYANHKRIKNMRFTIESNLDGEKKLQIFSEKEDELGSLGFQINRLTALYETSQKKYENEQLAKKQLIANLSHDVRTPLVSVIGYLEAIVQHRIGESQKDDYVSTAYEKAIVLKEQINQLFEFVQSDANEIELSMEKVDLCEMTRQVLIDFLPIVENEHIELESSIPDDEFNVLVDKESFIRIVQNIVKNTLVHGSEGKYLGVFVKKEDTNIYIDIADRGQGIDKEHMPFVFERLYKADSSRTRGGGIGLAIAKELANKMGGNIEILRSIPGDTVFRITFTEAK